MNGAPPHAGDDGFDVRSLALGFRRGARLGWHTHAWGQLVFADSGLLAVTTRDQAWLIPRTRAVWLPPGLPHLIEARGACAMRTLYLSRGRGAALPEAPGVLVVAPLLRELILHILGQGMLSPARPDHDRLAGLLVDLLIAARTDDLMLPLPRDARALTLADHLRRRPDDPRDVAELAKQAGASLRTLQRLFPLETGLTLDAWRRKARLVQAVGLLGGGDGVAQAALPCGYQSLSAFSEAFTRQFGVSPGRYFLERS